VDNEPYGKEKEKKGGKNPNPDSKDSSGGPIPRHLFPGRPFHQYILVIIIKGHLF